MDDEETGFEIRIVSASFADPYILLVRSDASVMILGCDKDGDIEEIEKGDALLATKWLSGCVFSDLTGAFTGKNWQQSTEGDGMADFLMFLLDAEGGLQVTLNSLS
jgi:cleavage and polyadenylation specificity factor subunit 1